MRKSSFVLTASDHGTMIVNRNDYQEVNDGGYGIGYQLLNKSNFDLDEVKIALKLLDTRKSLYGKDILALDCGANIGVHTIEWAKHMLGWGNVISFEPQERIFYALCGNIVLNNCSNARAVKAAIGEKPGKINVPVLDYDVVSSFGSLELKKDKGNEYIGQEVDYSPQKGIMTELLSIDSLKLKDVHFLKIDIEGMEIQAIKGAKTTISKFKPILMIEKIKSDQAYLKSMLEQLGYKVQEMNLNFLATHKDDPITSTLKIHKSR